MSQHMRKDKREGKFSDQEEQPLHFLKWTIFSAHLHHQKSINANQDFRLCAYFNLLYI